MLARNRPLGGTFRPKADEVTEGRRKMNDELHNLQSSPNIVRNRMNGDMCWIHSVHGRDSKCTHNFNWANERDRPLGKDVYEKITLK
jgi:hypothetical protein